MLLASLLALAGMAGYQYSKAKHKNKNIAAPTTTKTDAEGLSKAQTVYNYNYLDDSNTGNTLFDSQKKTKRTIFGNEGVM